MGYGNKEPKAKYFINAPGFVLGISDIPDVKIRIPIKFDSPEVLKDKKQFPIKLAERVNYYLRDRKDGKFYKITAYKNEGFDGATIKFYSWLIGYPLQPEFLTGAILHDKVCSDHSLIDNKRRLSSELLYELMLLTCTPKTKALIIREAVDIWQRLVYFWDFVMRSVTLLALLMQRNTGNTGLRIKNLIQKMKRRIKTWMQK